MGGLRQPVDAARGRLAPGPRRRPIRPAACSGGWSSRSRSGGCGWRRGSRCCRTWSATRRPWTGGSWPLLERRSGSYSLAVEAVSLPVGVARSGRSPRPACSPRGRPARPARAACSRSRSRRSRRRASPSRALAAARDSDVALASSGRLAACCRRPRPRRRRASGLEPGVLRARRGRRRIAAGCTSSPCRARAAGSPAARAEGGEEGEALRRVGAMPACPACSAWASARAAGRRQRVAAHELIARLLVARRAGERAADHPDAAGGDLDDLRVAGARAAARATASR